MSTSVAIVLFVAAITPGPNNFIVMDVAARSRLTAVFAPIAGIVTGTLGLILALFFGVEAVLDRWEHTASLLRFGGAGLLIFLAVRIIWGGWSESETADPDQLSTSNLSLFATMLMLQLVNPKTWVLALTVSTAHASTGDASLMSLVGLVATIPTACLLVWAVVGRTLQPVLAKPFARRAFVIAMGMMLLTFAWTLVVSSP